jgi:serine/threonine protein kinase
MPQGTRRTSGREAYISPERENGLYTTASDVWSAGATLFDLMTKKKKINVNVTSEEEREEEIRLHDALKVLLFNNLTFSAKNTIKSWLIWFRAC